MIFFKPLERSFSISALMILKWILLLHIVCDVIFENVPFFPAVHKLREMQIQHFKVTCSLFLRSIVVELSMQRVKPAMLRYMSAGRLQLLMVVRRTGRAG